MPLTYTNVAADHGKVKVFEVRVDGEVIWSRKERGRFPEIKEIKQLIRDRIAPGRSLGHTDSL
jgi:selenoprotein W-related protein